MNFQAFPDSCGYNVTSWWCPLTDLKVIGSLLLISAIVCFGGLWLWNKFRIGSPAEDSQLWSR